MRPELLRFLGDENFRRVTPDVTLRGSQAAVGRVTGSKARESACVQASLQEAIGLLPHLSTGPLSPMTHAVRMPLARCTI